MKMAILIRLPAKSLMKLRHVSKMWYSIIRSREFIDSFFSMLSRPGERLVFFFSFSHHQGDDKSSSSSLVANFEMAIPVLFDSFSSFASVHGMLTVKPAERHTKICNPSSEQVINLPYSTRFMGYDPVNDQYKVLDVYLRNPNQIPNPNHKVDIEHRVLTLGGGQRWRHKECTIPPYTMVAPGTCVNGVVYSGAYSPSRPMNPGIVCFDVRSEKLSYINTPEDLVVWGHKSIFIEYKGKLASIVRNPYHKFNSFDLWILEDVEKLEWSKQTCVFPLSLWDSVGCMHLSFPGANKEGEIIMAPLLLSRDVQPFYIFYYNVETNNIRRVRLLGIGDDEEFRRRYGLFLNGDCNVRIAPQHVESIAFFKDPII